MARHGVAAAQGEAMATDGGAAPGRLWLVWVNMGPLLYHFADAHGPDDDMSIELSLEDVKRVAYHYGFVMEVEKMIDTRYTANMASMMQNRYRATFWTMRKDASRSKAKKRQ
ncbi:hypothetical protein ZWY2020_044431 [Hordeum vulgare]|nr:hypothetical protein ZWY2020_044431 [Hordeum vulgare]